jgi:hypothetical protein
LETNSPELPNHLFYLKTLVTQPKDEAFSMREQGNFNMDKIKMMVCRMVNE